MSEKAYVVIDNNFCEEKVVHGEQEVQDFLNEGLDAGSAPVDMEVYELGKKLQFTLSQTATFTD